MSISVVIPSQNRRAVLLDVLAHLAQQTFPMDEFEVIVVDDASSDGTSAAVQAWSSPFRLQCIRLPPDPTRKSGICRPRNAGLAAARNDIIVLIDADILIHPGMLGHHAAVHRAAGDEPTAVIGKVYANGAPAERTPERLAPPAPAAMLSELPHRLTGPDSPWNDCRTELVERWPALATCPVAFGLFWGNNVSFPRRLALDCDGFDEVTYRGWGVEDVDFGYRLARRGAKIRYCSEAWGVHYPHPTGDYSAAFLRNLRAFVARHRDLASELWAWWFLSWIRSPPRTHDGGVERDRLHDRMERYATELRSLVERPPHPPPYLSALATRFAEVRILDGVAPLGLALPWDDRTVDLVVLDLPWPEVQLDLVMDLLPEVFRTTRGAIWFTAHGSLPHVRKLEHRIRRAGIPLAATETVGGHVFLPLATPG